MSKDEALKLALEALEIEQGAHAYLQLGKADHIENAITALREALVEQPAKQDIPDLIAGTLGVSRGTAYDLMREALAEQPAPVQESEKRECMNCAAFGECNPNNDAGRCGYEPPAAQRQWVGLTQEGFRDFATSFEYGTGGLIRAIEAKLKEKNT